MKKNCFIINTARGGIINQKGFILCIKTVSIIGGAGLDVYAEEPPDRI